MQDNKTVNIELQLDRGIVARFESIAEERGVSLDDAMYHALRVFADAFDSARARPMPNTTGERD